MANGTLIRSNADDPAYPILIRVDTSIEWILSIIARTTKAIFIAHVYSFHEALGKA
jgi:hypothetical protein